jgi:uncharacterized protein (TIGR03067 family)
VLALHLYVKSGISPRFYKFLTTYAASRLAFKAMKLFRYIITLVCIAASLIAHADELPTTKELQYLQGTWKGVMVGHEKNGDLTITITDNSLHFHRDAKFWFETTFTLPAGTDPKELHATINKGAQGQDSSVGKVVVAIYKIGDGKLTLVALGGGEEEKPKSFEDAEEKGLTRYELRKAQPQNKDAEPPKTK